ncbi:hypothetical protein OROHE_013215 [Orobanche hederae]
MVVLCARHGLKIGSLSDADGGYLRRKACGVNYTVSNLFKKKTILGAMHYLLVYGMEQRIDSLVNKVKEEKKAVFEFSPETIYANKGIVVETQEDEAELIDIKEGDIVNLPDLLFTENRNYLVKNNGQKVHTVIGRVAEGVLLTAIILKPLPCGEILSITRHRHSSEWKCRLMRYNGGAPDQWPRLKSSKGTSACLSPRCAFTRLEARPFIRSTSIISHQATLPFTTVSGNPEMKGGLSDEIYESQNQTFWELRFSCHYEYIDGKQYLKSMTIHGLWKNKLVNGEGKAENNLDYMKNMKRAMELLRDLKSDRPDVFLKMKKFWKSINHTTDQPRRFLVLGNSQTRVSR